MECEKRVVGQRRVKEFGYCLMRLEDKDHQSCYHSTNYIFIFDYDPTNKLYIVLFFIMIQLTIYLFCLL
jgi:hypothetical protein